MIIRSIPPDQRTEIRVIRLWVARSFKGQQAPLHNKKSLVTRESVWTQDTGIHSSNRQARQYVALSFRRPQVIIRLEVRQPDPWTELFEKYRI